jgi:hypothetical protein
MRSNSLRVLFIVAFSNAVACIPNASAFAHHSAAALYDLAKSIQLEGKLVQFSFRSPHSVVTIVADGEDGRPQRWIVAWNAASQLSRQGITRDFFRPGDEVVIVGHPGRNADDHIIVMTGLFRATDGFRWGDDPEEVFQ